MTVWVPIVFTLLFALSALCVVALAASMRVMLPQPIPDIAGLANYTPKPPQQELLHMLRYSTGPTAHPKDDTPEALENRACPHF